MTMGRPKMFRREDVLEKAIPVFWAHGFAATRLQDLEEATGVNKSGLYSEFADKEDLFLESLQYYAATSSGQNFLSPEPLGWTNIEDFLKFGYSCSPDRRGCFVISSMRELAFLPKKAFTIIAEADAEVRSLVLANVLAGKPKGDPELIADMIMTFFRGLCIEQGLKMSQPATHRKINKFAKLLLTL
jgi:AcrR family transcriptional regulator